MVPYDEVEMAAQDKAGQGRAGKCGVTDSRAHVDSAKVPSWESSGTAITQEVACE